MLSTSAGEGEGSPIGFFERYGFRQTGDIVFDYEVLLQLELGQAGGGRSDSSRT